MTETAQTPPASSPPPAQVLVDKKGRPLRGAALKVAQQKKATGKGPRPPAGKRGRGRHGDIVTSSRSSSSTPEPKKGDGILSRFARAWG